MRPIKTKPCDCSSIHETMTLLNEQGVGTNGNGIEVVPNSVILTVGPATVKIPMGQFKMFAEWYLEGQVKNETDEIMAHPICTVGNVVSQIMGADCNC